MNFLGLRVRLRFRGASGEPGLSGQCEGNSWFGYAAQKASRCVRGWFHNSFLVIQQCMSVQWE